MPVSVGMRVVLLDIFTPEIDGLETKRMVRRQQPYIPIIVISGRPRCWRRSTLAWKQAGTARRHGLSAVLLPPLDAQ